MPLMALAAIRLRGRVWFCEEIKKEMRKITRVDERRDNKVYIIYREYKEIKE